MLKEVFRFLCFTMGLLVLMAVSACGDTHSSVSSYTTAHVALTDEDEINSSKQAWRN